MAVGGGRVKMDLANLGAAQVVDLLSPSDEFGCIAVDSAPHIIHDLSLLTDKATLRNRILKINSEGGGIFVYEALEASYSMLQKAKSGTRHIILFSDAADVKVRNEETGVETALASNGAGAFTTPPLVLGTYSVTVDHAGFKKAVRSGIQLQGAVTIREDVTLALGAVTESVEVKAEAELNVTTADISHTVDERYYKDIPTITAADPWA